ncbi:MAG: restriction endonuclease subunit S, partial [Anaerolineae bacterium]
MKTKRSNPSQMTLEMRRPDDDRPPLPEGWVWTTIGDAYEVILGQSPPSSTYNAEGIGLPFYQGKAEFGGIFPVPVKWCSQPNKIAEAGDVLISVRAPVGPTNLCRERSCIGRGLSAIRPRDEMPNLYLFYYLRSIEQDWESKATGTTFSAINGKVLREQGIPLAPLPEQHRIVEAVETQFTRLDAAVAALHRVEANLARYKASVLKAACEGRLVPTEAALYRADRRGGASPESPLTANDIANARTPDRTRPRQGCLALLPQQPRPAGEGEAFPQRSDVTARVEDTQVRSRQGSDAECPAPTIHDVDGESPAAYEPADALLRRILAERRARWEEDRWQYEIERAKKKVAQAERKAKGLPYYIRDLEPEDWEHVTEEAYAKYLPKNDKWKRKYKEPEGPDTSELPELPAGWCW